MSVLLSAENTACTADFKVTHCYFEARAEFGKLSYCLEAAPCGFIQLLMLLFLADAVEYGEWKLGKRNEAASFAVQPFINQFGGAMSKGVISFTLIISGINAIANAVAGAEGNPDRIAEIINATPDSAIWIMKLSMMIFPLICILLGFVLYQKKFKIDEEFYAKIVSDLEERNGKKEEK